MWARPHSQSSVLSVLKSWCPNSVTQNQDRLGRSQCLVWVWTCGLHRKASKASFPHSDHTGVLPWLLGEATLLCGGLCSFQTTFPFPEPGCSRECSVEEGEGSASILTSQTRKLRLRVGSALFQITQPAADRQARTQLQEPLL